MPKLVYPDFCPDCGNPLSYSRRRGWFEKLFARLFMIRVFRCHRCGARFYSPPAVIGRAPEKSHHRWNRLSRELSETASSSSECSGAATDVEHATREEG